MHVKTHYQKNKIWFGEPYYKIPAVTVAPYKQRVLCMHYGVARAWMRCGKVVDGIFDQQCILLILRSCAAGFLKMGSQWANLLSMYGVFGINETNSG